MKKLKNGWIKWLTATFLLVVSVVGCSKNSSTQKITIEFQGNTRTCIIEKANSYSISKESPLLIVPHGHNESSHFIKYRIKNSTIFKRNGFLIVYPDGSGFLRYNWDDFETESAFINTIIDSLPHTYKIDTTKIYIAGFSQGGMLAYRMACDYSNRIVAIAIVGSHIDSNYINTSCTMRRAVPLISINSKLDHACPYDSLTYKGKWFNSVQSGVSAWASKSGCTMKPDSMYRGKNYEVHIWKKDNQEIAVLWTLAKGGHAWPQGRGLLYISHFEPSRIINANEIIWCFFSKHSVEKT